MTRETVAMACAESNGHATGAERVGLGGRAATLLRKTGSSGGAPQLGPRTRPRVTRRDLVSAAGEPRGERTHRARKGAVGKAMP